MGLPKGLTLNQRDIESWADSLLDTLTARERAARKEAEAAAAEREQLRLAARQAVQVRRGVGGSGGLWGPRVLFAVNYYLAELGRAEWREMICGGRAGRLSFILLLGSGKAWLGERAHW